ncbi:MAG: toll/interleukin-1 receptor domain-containing protein, partial [Pseudomonadota bacterium]
MGRRIFLSHSSIDKPAVEAIGRALEDRGIGIWLDKDHLERDAGPQDVVSQIDRGLEECDAGLVFFSAASRESFWVD